MKSKVAKFIADEAAIHVLHDLKALRSKFNEIETDNKIGGSVGSRLIIPGNYYSDIRNNVEKLLGELAGLDKELAEANYDETVSALKSDEVWTLGSVRHAYETREIHLGFIEPIFSEPILPRLSERVIAFLIEIEGYDDFLKREHHAHFGWHYHYLDRKKRRSNVILCWDIKTSNTPRPLFYEGHGEGSYDFPAKPHLWGEPKRKSMYDACAHELPNWKLETFKMASKDSEAVWPLGAALTS